MTTHNICFDGEVLKIISELLQNTSPLLVQLVVFLIGSNYKRK